MMHTSTTDVFQAGGSLPKEIPTYITRAADDELYRNIRSNNFCYILTARQMGKSSLRVRTMDKLEREGYACVAIDISKLGSRNTNSRQWYFSFLHQIARPFGLLDDLQTWWRENIKLTQAVRFHEFFEYVLLRKVKGNIVIFLDEIDSILGLDRNEFNPDDFFATLRGQYNARVDNPEFRRLNFVIIGVASPDDLMSDNYRTPFNIGVPIRLDNFSLSDAAPLEVGFSHIRTDVKLLVHEIFYWTGGQPVLTQTLCKAIAENESVINDIPSTVKRYVEDIFLTPRSIENQSNLYNVQNRILSNETYRAQMIGLYQQILSGENVRVNIADKTHIYLRLSGIVHDQNSSWVVSNRIYSQRFNQEWVLSSLEKINRPFAQEINQWISAGKPEKVQFSAALMDEVYAWSQGRSDLSALERRFIDVVIHTQRNKERRQKRMWSIGFIITLLFLGLAVMFAVYAYRQKEIADTNAAEANRMRAVAESVRDSLNQKQNELQQTLQLVQFQRDTAKVREKEAWVLRQEADQQRQIAIFQKKNVETEKQRINSLSEALRRTSLSQQKVDQNPTAALKMAIEALEYDPNDIVIDNIYRIYSTNIFYRIVSIEDDDIQSAFFSPDGNYMMAVCDNMSAHVWDENCNLMLDLTNEDEFLSAAVFTPDSRQIITFHPSLARYHSLDGKVLQSLQWTNDATKSLVLSPDGKSVLASTPPKTATLWNLGTNTAIVFNGHASFVYNVAFSPDGKYVLTAGDDNMARLWDMKGNSLQTFRHDSWVSAALFSPSGNKILTASGDRTLKIWKTDGTLINTLIGHEDKVLNAAFSADGQYIASASNDRTIRLWSEAGNELQVLRGHENAVKNVSFAPDNRRLLSSGLDQTIRLWYLTNLEIKRLTNQHNSVLTIAVSPKYILAGSADSTAILYDQTGKYIQTLRGHNSEVSCADISPDGKYFVTGSAGKNVILWDAVGNVVRTFDGHTDQISDVRFSPDGTMIVTVSFDNTARVWTTDGKLVCLFSGHDKRIWAADFSPDGELVVTGSSDRTLRLWNLQGHEQQQFIGHDGGITSVAFSPDGKYIVSGSFDKTCRVWNTDGTMHDQRTFAASVLSVAFSPDSKTIACGSWDNAAYLLDLDCNMLQVYRGHRAGISAIAFSPDGRYLFTGSSDHTIRQWSNKPLLQDFLLQQPLGGLE